MFRNFVIRAEGICKGYRQEDHFCWVLKGLNIEILEGESVAILGAPGSGKTTLLKILSFREKPEKGQLYFQDRLLGWDSKEEIVQMQNERVLLLNSYIQQGLFEVDDGGKISAVLMDEPEIIICSNGKCILSGQLNSLNSKGIAVIVATCKPEVASRTGVIYKLKNGKLEKITGKIKKFTSS